MGGMTMDWGFALALVIGLAGALGMVGLGVLLAKVELGDFDRRSR